MKTVETKTKFELKGVLTSFENNVLTAEQEKKDGVISDTVNIADLFKEFKDKDIKFACYIVDKDEE